MNRSGSDTGFYDKCSAVRVLRVYLRPRFSLHRTENDNITLRPLECRYHSDMEFSVYDKSDKYCPILIRKLIFLPIFLNIYSQRSLNRSLSSIYILKYFIIYTRCSSSVPSTDFNTIFHVISFLTLLHGKKRSGCHRHKNIVPHNIVGSSNKIEERTVSMDAFSKGNGGVSNSILLREILMYQP